MESLKNKQQNNSQTLKWIFARTKKFIPLIVVISVFSAAVSLSGIVLALLSKNVLEIATGDAEGDFWFYAGLILAIVAVQILLFGADTILKAYAGGKLTISMRNYLFNVLNRKKYGRISQYHSGDILNRFTSDTDVVISCFTNLLPRVAAIVAQIIGGFWALVTLDWRIAVIIVAVGILVPGIGRFVSRKYKYMHKECQQTEGKTRSFLQECFENIVVVKTFQSIAPFTGKLNQYMKKNFNMKIKRSVLSAVMNLSLYSFFTLGYYAVMLWGAGKISSDTITYGTLMAFLQLFQQLRAPLQSVSGIVPQYFSALASAERLIEIESGEEDKPSEGKEKLLSIKQNFRSVELNNVCFSYKDENVLENCSFSIPAGKITALTGESGSGKSTVFKILLGLYDTKSGSITVNGKIPLDTSLRGMFAYVPQGNLVLSGTIRENITLCDDTVSEEDIIKAVKAAEIYDLIMSLPDGLDTVLSERGAGISEGQIQRISIARALLADAPVLLLDEATSALDEETESRVLNNIKNMNSKTVLFVTHRNTSLRVCDRIVHVTGKKFTLIKG